MQGDWHGRHNKRLYLRLTPGRMGRPVDQVLLPFIAHHLRFRHSLRCLERRTCHEGCCRRRHRQLLLLLLPPVLVSLIYLTWIYLIDIPSKPHSPASTSVTIVWHRMLYQDHRARGFNWLRSSSVMHLDRLLFFSRHKQPSRNTISDLQTPEADHRIRTGHRFHSIRIDWPRLHCRRHDRPRRR
jgi:hypothetical protein